ncbi:MAG: hypothetical protein AAF727_04310 [Pseudomonadota bacterium]
MPVTKAIMAAVLATALPIAGHAATFFELNDVEVDDIDTATTTTVSFEVTTTGTISDLNLLLFIDNPDRTGVVYPGTIAWGDLNVTLSKDGVSAKL